MSFCTFCRGKKIVRSGGKKVAIERKKEKKETECGKE